MVTVVPALAVVVVMVVPVDDKMDEAPAKLDDVRARTLEHKSLWLLVEGPFDKVAISSVSSCADDEYRFDKSPNTEDDEDRFTLPFAFRPLL